MAIELAQVIHCKSKENKTNSTLQYSKNFIQLFAPFHFSIQNRNWDY